MFKMQSKEERNCPKKENRTGIPMQMKTAFEQKTNLSFDDVRVYYGSERPSKLGALAYTQGSQVYIGPGQEKHLWHELGHVVQQKQGRVSPTGTVGGMKLNNDAKLEREADTMLDKVTFNHSGTEQMQAAEGAVIQRKGVYEDFQMNAFQSASWFQKAEDFEKRLGSYAYSHPAANRAAEEGLWRILEILEEAGRIPMLPMKDTIDINGDDEIQGIRKNFFSDDHMSAGQVGGDISEDVMGRIFLFGSLRERMTAFYNAAYFKCGYGDGVKGLKGLLSHIIFNKKIEVYRRLRLNEPEAEKQMKYFEDSRYRGVVEWITSMHPNISRLFAKDLFALGNLVSQSEHWISDLYEIAMSQKNRNERTDAEKERHSKTAGDYETMGAPLSEEEIELAFPWLKSGLVDLFEGPQPRADAHHTLPLPWNEGEKLFEIRPEASWFQEVHDTLKLPVIAGVSGTTTRMLKVFQIMNVPGVTQEEFRLAIMGWMLTSRDHSLYEILRGSHIAGLKPQGEEEGVRDATKIYRNIAPLGIGELRGIADHGMFPHELLYQELTKLEDINPSKISGEEQGEANHAENDLLVNKQADVANHTQVYDDMNAAQAIAIRGYTTGMHVLYNTVLSYPTETMAVNRISSELKKQADYYIINGCKAPDWIGSLTPFINSFVNCRIQPNPAVRESLKKRLFEQMEKLAKDLYPVMKIHAAMTEEGLKALPPANGVVYRGDWRAPGVSSYSPGVTQETASFTSYTKSRNVALQFARKYKGSLIKPPIMIRMMLTGRNGRDVSGLSKYPGEQEILMLPGANISYQYITQDGAEPGIPLLDAIEV